MASAIWNEKENRWTLRVSIGGKIKKFTSVKKGITGKKEVLRKYREYMDGSAAAPIMVENAWSTFLDNVIKKNGKTDAWINLDKYGRLYILPRIGRLLVSNLTILQLQDIINNARPVSDRVDQLSKKTLLNIRGAIMQFVHFCVAAGWMDQLRGELYVPKNAPKKGKVILQPDAIRRLFDGPAAGDWYINVFRFGCVTGLRTGEILGIKTSDIQNGVLTISRSINHRNEITEGKNENARRQIYLNEIARRIIEENIRRNKPYKTDWIFCNKAGGFLTQSTLRNNWIRIAKERDLPGSPYSLRHTFISLMQCEMSPAMLRQIVGHSALTDTVKLYGHQVDGQMQQSAHIIDITMRKIVE